MARQVATQVQNGKLVEERRERIIAAAISVFRRKGFHVATTKDVATEAGITQSNLYNYIQRKDDILFLVCEHLVGLYRDALEQVARRCTDPHARLVEALRAVIAVMCDHKEELQLLYNEAHSLEKHDRRLVLATISKFIERFQDLLADYEAAHGPIRVKNKRLAANLLSFVPAVVALRTWDLAGRVTPAELEAQLLEFVLTGLGIPARRKLARNVEPLRP